MDIRKYEKLINLVINEDTKRAHELFHEIVVEKSREIFESIMADEDMMEDDMEEGMGGQAGDLLDEINAEESGVMEDDDEENEADIDFDDEAEDAGDEMTHDLEMDHDDEHEEHEEHEEIEDAVIRIEDKLDQLMAEFEEIMGGAEHEEGPEMGDDSEDEMDDESEDEMDEDMMMENITLQKVSVHHGDDGAQRKSTVAFNSGQAGMASKPVRFSGDNESVPTGPKSASNSYTKGEGSLPGAGTFKNSPGKGNFSEKGESTPKPVKKDESSNHKSPVAESRRNPRRPVR
jgi:hypothetical protein